VAPVKKIRTMPSFADCARFRNLHNASRYRKKNAISVLSEQGKIPDFRDVSAVYE
jgi:hypothetical protein